MVEYFVYYRVGDDSAPAALVAARTMQAALCTRHVGLQARLLHRPARPGETQTWMETYRGGEGDLLAEIEAAAAGWSGLLDGPRHVESFEPFADR